MSFCPVDKPNVIELMDTFRCTDCGLLTSRYDATQRIFNPGTCGHCGGRLVIERWGNRSTLAENAMRAGAKALIADIVSIEPD